MLIMLKFMAKGELSRLSKSQCEAIVGIDSQYSDLYDGRRS